MSLTQNHSIFSKRRFVSLKLTWKLSEKEANHDKPTSTGEIVCAVDFVLSTLNVQHKQNYHLSIYFGPMSAI